MSQSLTFLGDVFLPKACRSLVDLNNFIPNLEYPVTVSRKAYPGKINLRADRLYLKETFGNQPLAVCLANNHIMDYGEKGLNDTITCLEQVGIQHWGAGTLNGNCNNPLIIRIDESKVAFIGYVCLSTSPVVAKNVQPGVSVIDRHEGIEGICSMIRHLKANGVDRVVVSLHWGAEDVTLPKPNDINLAHVVIDAGADLILGHHAHICQPIEKYKEHYIFYGLGNCIFPDLDVDSFYDVKTNTFARKYVKKQNIWNRYSLAVRYFPASNRVETRRLKFKHGLLTSVDDFMQPSKRHGLKVLDGENYDICFKCSYLFGTYKAALVNYVKNPKMIGLKHLKIFLDLMNSKSYH